MTGGRPASAFPPKEGKVSPESKDGVMFVYRVPQKLLNTTGYKLIELTDSLLAFIH